ncbi:unnamed protein product [Agarophyton chilense]|eukprot:gb/GEZJ01001006.1/.p1 GENE.gb/GEZJ01001006.1/~~gb/GEZJ01001006.1/.p1  ORF type:complete len:2058 (-),score=271.02 gb/GEZJ01001006.1/:1032-7205(-)
MPGAGNLVIQRGAIIDQERLCSAIQCASASDPCSPADDVQLEVIAELRACRTQIADPLDPSIDQLPNPEARSRLSNIGENNVVLHDDEAGTNVNQPKSAMRLGADLVAVAIALSDELQINELDAAVLLFDARVRASHRPDHDVVAAAKELYALRRRQRVQYLQEVVRAALLTPSSVPRNEESFVSLLMRERDVLFVEHQVFSNLVSRLHDGYQAERSNRTSIRDQRGLYYGEYLLLAETIFLLAYTVQLTSAEALALRQLMSAAESFLSNILERDRSHLKPGRVGFAAPTLQDTTENWSFPFSEVASRESIEAEGVCNLLLLAWMSTLDRSRYHDLYDPRTGQKGVNCLLKDLSFISRTSGMPVVGDDDQEVRNMPKRIAAGELVASVFRLAVAAPDEEEAIGTFLRVSAYAGALSFMSHTVSSWIEKRGGSLSPDVDLYADVMEDLALDIAEAAHLVGAVIQFSQNEVYAAASEAAYASLDGAEMTLLQGSSQRPAETHPFLNTLSSRRTSLVRRDPLQKFSLDSEQRKRPSIGAKPPRQPSVSASGGLSSLRDLFALSPTAKHDGNTNIGRLRDEEHSSKSNITTSENLIASLATFVAQCISLAPSKLANDSIGGGLRYWVGIGQANLGFIPRIGDAVTDLWDASMRNAYATGGVGAAFREALESFLLLLKNTSLKSGSPTHAAAALRYLCQGGHPVVSLERTADAMSYIHAQMIRSTSGNPKELDVAESDALRGIIDVVANAAEAVSSQSGVLPVLGDAGKELPMRMGALVTLEIPVGLKGTLLSALKAVGNKTVVSLVLKSFARDKAALLRRFMRSTESQTGNYDVTLRVLEMTNDSMYWNENELPRSAAESIITWFVIEEVLMFWSRRKYAEEAHRWKLIHRATTLIISYIKRSPSPKSSRLLARLLTPAPGTGAASYALKALFNASGLMRTNDEVGGPTSDESLSQAFRGHHKTSGRACLNHAAELGMGDSFREMQKAAQSASVLNRMLLSVPPGRLMVPGVVVAPASALILGETKALISASTLVFLANGFEYLISKAGYNPAVCSSVLAMLARATQESYQIGIALTRDVADTKGSASQFRSSLADLISQSSREVLDTNQDEKCEFLEQTPPIMHSALRVVEATLGVDGGGAPGLFLLGVESDSTGRHKCSEYGVLRTLLELIAGSMDTRNTLDSKPRATAATFLERLSANTTKHTSVAVLEHIREIGEGNSGIRGCGFGDEMLYRILESYGNSEPRKYNEDVNWSALSELMSSCLRLSALQARLFPRFEMEKMSNHMRNVSTLASESSLVRGPLWESGSCLPSPLELLRALAAVASSGELQGAFDGLKAWYLLLGTRIISHESHSGYSAVPLLLEVASILLDAIASTDSNRGISKLVRSDGGEVAASAILLCVKRLRDCANSSSQETPHIIGDVQYGSLLNGIVHAISGTIGVGANSVRARTALYGAFVICGPLAQKTGSEDVLASSLGGRFGHQHVSGTEGIISAACKDAVSAPTPASRCAAIAVVSVTTALDPIRAIPALGTQNRLSRVIQYTLLNADVQKAMLHPYSRPLVPDLQRRNEDYVAVASIDSALSLIHSVAASGNGAGLIVDSGCMEALRSILGTMTSRDGQNFRSLNDDMEDLDFSMSDVGGRTSNMNQEMSDQTLQEKASPVASDSVMMDKSPYRPRSIISTLVTVTNAVTAVVCCGGPTIFEGTESIIGEGLNAYLGLLRTIRVATKDHLQIASCLGMILSRVPDDIIETATSGSLLRFALASALSSIVPPPSKLFRPGDSSSLLSVGVDLLKPANTKEARRIRVMHPEGGSLYERDLIVMRALCVKNVLAALRDQAHVLQLFTPELKEVPSLGTAGSFEKGSSFKDIGRLSDIFRICRTMLQELQRSISEGSLMEMNLSGGSGSLLSSKKLQEVTAFCREQYKVEAEATKLPVIQECLRKAVVVINEHSEACMKAFESCLLILREYVRCAQDTVRGRATAGLYNDVKFRSGDENTRLCSSAMKFTDAQRLLEETKGGLVPLCKEIENLRDSAWSGRDSSFAKQVCRQIRTACSDHG